MIVNSKTYNSSVFGCKYKAEQLLRCAGARRKRAGPQHWSGGEVAEIIHFHRNCFCNRIRLFLKHFSLAYAVLSKDLKKAWLSLYSFGTFCSLVCCHMSLINGTTSLLLLNLMLIGSDFVVCFLSQCFESLLKDSDFLSAVCDMLW